MKALVYDGPRSMSIRERAIPTVEPGDALVRIEAAGVCGSELASFTGHSTRRAPGRVFGHELAGKVEAVGAPGDAPLVGDRVAINPLLSCGHCASCLGGRHNICLRGRLLGREIDGGFAEYVVVPVTALAANHDLDAEHLTLVEPLANAVHVVRLLGTVAGRSIAVLGSGAIGLCVITALVAAGADPVIAVDTVERRRDIALTAAPRPHSPPTSRSPTLTTSSMQPACPRPVPRPLTQSRQEEQSSSWVCTRRRASCPSTPRS